MRKEGFLRDFWGNKNSCHANLDVLCWVYTNKTGTSRRRQLLVKLYQKLKSKAKSCRDRDIRIKLELILLALKLGNVSEACARRGFSRQFHHRWFKRLKKANWDLGALSEKSRRPFVSPNQTRAEIEKAVHWYRDRQYGSRMIEAMLGRDDEHHG